MQRPTRYLFVAPFVLLFATNLAVAQVNVERVGSAYIPADAVATAVLNVSDTMSSPAAELYPTEVADAWCKQNVGILASDIERIKLVVGMPGPGAPMLGVVFQLRADMDVRSLNPQWVNVEQPMDLEGNSVYELAAAPGMVLYVKDPRTVFVASESYLPSMLLSAAGESSGPLARMAASVPHTATLTTVVGVELLRPMLNGIIQSQAEEIPPPLVEFTRIPDLIDAVMLRVDLQNSEQGLQMVMLAGDESKADECLGIITNGIRMGQQIFLAQMDQQFGQDDAVAQATRQYMQRMSSHYADMMTPKKNGRRLTITGEASQGMATQGVLVALLLPAVQSAREAARRMTSANNLKQLALAMHNYHDVYRRFPTDITRDDGTPLLSWRVAILPYVEGMALYEQFKLDEPWDSPNNLPLLNKMPAVLTHPGMQTAPGTTVYQRPVGEGLVNEAAKFSDFRDGTSNTIMGVETVAGDAVEWTKPADIQLDVENPVAAMGAETRPGFNVMMADGSVRYLSTLIDPEVFKALLTCAGGEAINQADLQ